MGRHQLQTMTRRSTAACAPRCNTALRSPRAGWWHYGPSSQYDGACVPSHAALRAPRGRYHMLQLIGWVGIKPALLLFLSAFTDVRRCLSSRLRPSDFPEGAPLRFEGALCRFGFFEGEGASLALPLWLARSSVPQQGGFSASQLNCALSESARSLQVGLPA